MEAQGTKYCNGGPSCIQRIHAISTSPLESIMYRNIAPFVHLQIFKQYQYQYDSKIASKANKNNCCNTCINFFF